MAGFSGKVLTSNAGKSGPVKPRPKRCVRFSGKQRANGAAGNPPENENDFKKN
jgi:hypothetical protein